MEWREKKGYMLIERITINNKVNGGNIHLTGYGDYALSCIEILENPFEE